MLGSKRTILVFPGQGSQYPGMAKDLYDRFDVVKEVYTQASGVVGYDMAELCFGKSESERRGDLDKTIYTQTAVLTTGYACFRAFEEACQKKNVAWDTALLAGHSLGEYTALLVSGAMTFETCLRLVQKRATYMTESGEKFPGAGLMALMDRNGGLDFDRIRGLCEDFGVHITLNNTKRQIVVGGSRDRLSAMSKQLNKKETAVKMLNVEGPFHTPMMKPAADKLKGELESCDISIAAKPIIANVSTHVVVDPAYIRHELYEQVFHVVNWRQSMEKAIGNGGHLFIEIGPKKVLTHMLKDIDPSVEATNVEDLASLKKTIEKLRIRS